MYTFSLNIGYESSTGSSGVLNKLPMIYRFDTPKDFTNFVRNNSIRLVDWAIQNHVPKSSLMLYVTINRFYEEEGEDWIWSNEFHIHLKNIREYIPYLDMTDEEIEAEGRDKTIDDVLNG